MTTLLLQFFLWVAATGLLLSGLIRALQWGSFVSRALILLGSLGGAIFGAIATAFFGVAYGVPCGLLLLGFAMSGLLNDRVPMRQPTLLSEEQLAERLSELFGCTQKRSYQQFDTKSLGDPLRFSTEDAQCLDVPPEWLLNESSQASEQQEKSVLNTIEESQERKAA